MSDSKLCKGCASRRPVLRRPKNGDKLCKECFFEAFEEEVHTTIVRNNLFKRGEKVAIGASGGKDSTVLAYVLKELNERHDYGVHLCLLSIDEGITGYRDDSLECVKQNSVDYKMPLHILSYKDLYGWSMDDIVAEIGLKGNCTFCGVFRRQALDRGARALGVDKIVTGHNADDMAETVLMNLLRGDIARLGRCVNAITGIEGDLPRSKPFKYCYEKEIVMYAYHRKLIYFSTECIYSPNAYRGYAREYIKELELIRPSVILDIIHSAEAWKAKEGGSSGPAPATGTTTGTTTAVGGEVGDACKTKEGGSGGCGCKSGKGDGEGSGSCCGGAGSCGCKAPKSAAVGTEGVASSGSSALPRNQGQQLTTHKRVQTSCLRCGYMTSSAGGEALCQACNLLAGLEAGKPRVALTMGAGAAAGEGKSAGATTTTGPDGPTRAVKWMMGGHDVADSF
jgi:cytoplasmic tRNA 2-thiolation protein 1